VPHTYKRADKIIVRFIMCTFFFVGDEKAIDPVLANIPLI